MLWLLAVRCILLALDHRQRFHASDLSCQASSDDGVDYGCYILIGCRLFFGKAPLITCQCDNTLFRQFSCY